MGRRWGQSLLSASDDCATVEEMLMWDEGLISRDHSGWESPLPAHTDRAEETTSGDRFRMQSTSLECQPAQAWCYGPQTEKEPVLDAHWSGHVEGMQEEQAWLWHQSTNEEWVGPVLHRRHKVGRCSQGPAKDIGQGEEQHLTCGDVKRGAGAW
ncbi:hypothetical protein NDU88_005423 [Pleurodeles waltl]|uniref:Uncharacterized protein n=1 Tax=Pleurodeles waltl TaxID=8319 RepID=A0AAV7MCV7_PLEWA|nr:hypothetical protein NDU88_005423 [Pleurodeles waltl]